MIQFLLNHNIQVARNLNKNQVFSIIKSQNFQSVYAVEDLCAKHGVDVLRLPPYHCMLNPIELAWSSLKNLVRRSNTMPCKPTTVVGHVRHAASMVTSAQWKNFVGHVIKLEEEMSISSQHVFIHDSIKNICVNVNSDSDSE